MSKYNDETKLNKKLHRMLEHDKALVTPTPGLPNTPTLKPNITPKVSFNKPFTSQIKHLVKDSDYITNIEKQLKTILFSKDISTDKFFHIIKLQLLLLYKPDHVECIIDYWADREKSSFQGLFDHLSIITQPHNYILLLRCLEKGGNTAALSLFLDEVAQSFYYDVAGRVVVADYLPDSFRSKKDHTALLRAITIYVGYKHLQMDKLIN